MTYAEMIASDTSGALYKYTELGITMGVGTSAEITRTIGELSIDVATMRFERVA